MFNPYDNPYGDSGGNHIHVEYKRNNLFKRKKTGSATVNAGGAIIIIIFVVLCLTIFGLLSFTTAFADKKLADRTLKNVQDYYLADTQAEQTLAEIYSEVYNIVSNSSDFMSELSAVIREARNIPGVELIGGNVPPDVMEDGEIMSLIYQTQMNDVQALSSEIAFYYNNGKLDYKITRWNIILTADFDYGSQEYDVWDGGFDFWN